MRISLPAALTYLVLLLISGCAETQSGGLAHPNIVIVREFAAPVGVVTLDPSFGFSLDRGAPVPPRQRGEAVARSASFALADSIAERLRALGFDVLRSNTAEPEPGARALIVTGRFRKINEGYRRQVGAENSGVEVDSQVEYRAAGAPPQNLLTLHLDSSGLRGEGGVTPAGGRGGPGISSDARRVGAEIARSIADLAGRNNWPTAAR